MIQPAAWFGRNVPHLNPLPEEEEDAQRQVRETFVRWLLAANSASLYLA
jgi:hypothetical protein